MDTTASKIFKQIAASKVSTGGVYFVPGNYLVSVAKAFLMTSRKGSHLAIVECEILESDVAERPVGSRASWVVNMSQDAGPGNVKAFIAAAIGISPSDTNRVDAEVTEEFCAEAFGETNPLEGVKLKLQCSQVKTRAGTDFTRHFWEPSEE